MNPKADPLLPPTCVVCGYDLRAAPADGKCPECGSEVDRSLHGDWLRFADHGWTSLVERGLGWTWRGVTAVLSSLVAMLVFVMIIAGAGLFVSSGLLPDWIETTFVVIVVLFWLVGGTGLMVGLWMLSTPEPRSAATQPLRPIMLRVLTAAVVPVIVLWIGADGFWTTLGGAAAWVKLSITMLSIVVVGSQTWLLVNHLRSLEHRCYGLDAKRDKLLGKYRGQVMGVSISVAILAVGTYAIYGRTLGAGLVIIAWVAVLGLARETHRRVRFELAIRPDDVKTPAGEVGA